MFVVAVQILKIQLDLEIEKTITFSSIKRHPLLTDENHKILRLFVTARFF